MQHSCQNHYSVLTEAECTSTYHYLKGKENAFFDPNGEMQLTEDAYHFTAGILNNARGFTAVCNPLVNSYKRLVPGYEAPCYIAWSGKTVHH